MTATNDSTIWAWSPTLDAETRRRLQLVVIVGAVADLVVVGIAAVTQTRFAVVMAVLVTCIGVFWFLEHRRLMATRFTIDTAGRLTMADTRTTESIDLERAERIEVRQRSTRGIGVSSLRQWSVEIAGSGEAVHHRLANVGGAFLLPESEIRALEQELRRHVPQDDPQRHDAQQHHAQHHDVGQQRVARIDAFEVGASTSNDRFEWQPKVGPHASRNRRLLWLGLGGPALAIAVYAVVAYRDEGIVAVLLTAATVPGILLIIAWSFDAMQQRGRSFRIVAEHGQLHIGRPGRQKTLPLAGSTLKIDMHHHTTFTGTGTPTQGARWALDVTTVAGERAHITLPSFGTSTTRDDYISLERELQRLT